MVVQTSCVAKLIPRSRLTERLIRILETLDAGRTPFVVKQLYVFGSYARGAPAPSDLDLLLIHEPIPTSMLEEWTTYYYDRFPIPRYQARSKAHYRCLSALGKTIRRPGEKIDIIYETDVDRALAALLGRDDAKLLWALDRCDWKERLASIALNPEAGTAPRNHIVSVKRIADERSSIETIVDAIAHDEMRLTRIPFQELPALSHQRELQLREWQRCGVAGKKSLKLMPHIFAYFQTLRQQPDYMPGGELSIWSTSHSTLVQFGTPRLWHAVYYLQRNRKLKRVAFFLHLKQDEPNEVLVFERGANWATQKMDERARLRSDV